MRKLWPRKIVLSRVTHLVRTGAGMWCQVLLLHIAQGFFFSFLLLLCVFFLSTHSVVAASWIGFWVWSGLPTPSRPPDHRDFRGGLYPRLVLKTTCAWRRKRRSRPSRVLWWEGLPENQWGTSSWESHERGSSSPGPGSRESGPQLFLLSHRQSWAPTGDRRPCLLTAHCPSTTVPLPMRLLFIQEAPALGCHLPLLTAGYKL